jgi:NAD(P)-dependent dehydrogenase (short-subunit alcohol dehydrogenase family)
LTNNGHDEAMNELAEQVAIVTGGGQGIGQRIAAAFAGAGATVVVTGRTAATLAETVALVEQAGRRALAIVADVAKQEDCERMVAETLGAFGRLDILVNNAGIAGATKSTLDMSLDEWQEVIDIDLTGPWLCTKAVLPTFLTVGSGVILNISSAAGRVGYPNRAPYAAAKWGLVGLTQTWAREWGMHGVRTNCICPGAIAGDRIERVIAARAESLGMPIDKVRAGFVSQSSMGRMANEDEVASIALMLCSPSSSGVNGQTVNVDCGTHMN